MVITVVGRLVPIVFTQDVESLLGDCVVCTQPLDVDLIARLDWIDNVILHLSCVRKYIENYMRDHPSVTILEIQVMFGISRKTAYRRLSEARNGIR